MSQATTLPTQSPHQAACTCRHRWCPRRIHALGGVPVGLLVVAHLAIAVTGLWPQRYQGLVNQIHRLGSALPVIELTLIFVPLLAQAVYGLRMLAKTGMAYRTGKKSRGGDLRFFVQRLSAVILLLFLGFHVATMHRWGFHLFHPDGRAFPSTAAAIRSCWGPESVRCPANLLVAGFYALGIWAACYHLANGLATGAMAWGIAVTETARRRSMVLCLGVGVVLTFAGTAAWCAFVFGPLSG